MSIRFRSVTNRTTGTCTVTTYERCISGERVQSSVVCESERDASDYICELLAARVSAPGQVREAVGALFAFLGVKVAS